MALRNVMKEYLVSLGFNVDRNKLSDALDVVKLGEGKISSLVSKMSTSLGKGTAGIVTMIASAVVAVGKFTTSVAEADIATQNAANSMWMNVDAYRVTQNAVESLGYSMNELSTIARNPELTNRFSELVELGKQTAAPKELDSMLKKVRDVTFEFDKMQVIAKNGIRQIVYYFLKYLGVDLDNMQNKLASVNKFLQENLPKIAAAIAKVLYYIYRVGKAIGYVISLGAKLIGGIYNFMKKFPSTFKVFIGIISAILLAINPVLTIILAGLSAIILLIDDYMTWQRGGKSYFGDSWKKVEDFIEKAKDKFEWLFEKIEWAVDYIMDSLGPFFEWLFDAFDSAFGWLKDVFKGVNEFGYKVGSIPDWILKKDQEIDEANEKVNNWIKEKIKGFFGSSDESESKKSEVKYQYESSKNTNTSYSPNMKYEQNINVKGSVDENTLRKINQQTKRMLEVLDISSVVR
jgi:hypothetical protein|nr:MAG TPA: hypothetical protein [Caudoviricetes sp.]